MRAKMFAIGLGIALLLPMAVVTGFNIAHTPPKWETFYEKNYDALRASAASSAEKKQLTAQEAQERKKLQAADKEYERGLYMVAFPVGLAAAIVGALIGADAVGGGLLFGGIILLTGGCWTYWDKMTSVGRFVTILIALAVFTVLGILKRGRPKTVVERVPVEPVEGRLAA